MSFLRWFTLNVGVFAFISSSYASLMVSDPKIPETLRKADIIEKLNNKISINELKFYDESGKLKPLNNFFGEKPILLSLVYYKCPSLCNFHLNGLTSALKKLDWNIGEKFNAISVSINPDEDSKIASLKKKNYIESYGRKNSESGWHFLTSDEENVKRLANEVGFNYYYDEEIKEYAHSSSIIVLTPSGVISRYLYGIQFDPNDIRLSLLEASNGIIGSPIEKLMLFCYRYNPNTRGYSIQVNQIVKATSLISFFAIGIYLLWFFLIRVRRNKN